MQRVKIFDSNRLSPFVLFLWWIVGYDYVLADMISFQIWNSNMGVIITILLLKYIN